MVVDLPILGQTEVEEYLLLGGPKHGHYHTVGKGQNEAIIMAPVEPNSLPTPVKYMRRVLQAQTPNGVFARTVFVEQSMPPELATSAIQAILLQEFALQLVTQWMEGGERIGTGEG
jgi:hypothetical protein